MPLHLLECPETSYYAQVLISTPPYLLAHVLYLTGVSLYNLQKKICVRPYWCRYFTARTLKIYDIIRKIVFFFTNLMHKFFILIHLLHSSTCFEHYCAHLQEDNCINTASGIVNMETSEWSKLLKYIVCCIIRTLENSKIHIKSLEWFGQFPFINVPLLLLDVSIVVSCLYCCYLSCVYCC